MFINNWKCKQSSPVWTKLAAHAENIILKMDFYWPGLVVQAVACWRMVLELTLTWSYCLMRQAVVEGRTGKRGWEVEGRVWWLSGCRSAIIICSAAHFHGEGRSHCARWGAYQRRDQTQRVWMYMCGTELECVWEQAWPAGESHRQQPCFILFHVADTPATHCQRQPTQTASKAPRSQSAALLGAHTRTPAYTHKHKHTFRARWFCRG